MRFLEELKVIDAGAAPGLPKGKRGRVPLLLSNVAKCREKLGSRDYFYMIYDTRRDRKTNG
jgi:hypothetical protein